MIENQPDSEEAQMETKITVLNNVGSPENKLPRNKYYEIFMTYSSFGLTLFGGPPAHFSFFQHLFVDKLRWISSSTFSQIYAVSNALPGPASTQTAFTIAFLRAGLLPAILAFLLWNVPGMLIMIAVAISVEFIPTEIPLVVVFIRSGISAVSIGLIGAAGYKLTNSLKKENAYDPVLVFICFLSVACSVLFYSTVWSLPVIIVAGGLIRYSLTWIPLKFGNRSFAAHSVLESESEKEEEDTHEVELHSRYKSWWITAVCFGLWLALLIYSLIIGKYLVPSKFNSLFLLLAAFYIGGSIIFGGGPVVVPLLYNYVVVPGWLSPQQFLFGLAIVNILPGPNFNFAAYAGGLSWIYLSGASGSFGIVGSAILGGILSTYTTFFPGLLIQVAVIPIWDYFRKAKKIMIFFDGVCAAAIGLIFGSVFSLWQNLRQMDTKESKTLSEEFEFTLALLAFAASVYNVFPLWTILASTALTLIYFGIS